MFTNPFSLDPKYISCIIATAKRMRKGCKKVIRGFLFGMDMEGWTDGRGGGRVFRKESWAVSTSRSEIDCVARSLCALSRSNFSCRCLQVYLRSAHSQTTACRVEGLLPRCFQSVSISVLYDVEQGTIVKFVLALKTGSSSIDLKMPSITACYAVHLNVYRLQVETPLAYNVASSHWLELPFLNNVHTHTVHLLWSMAQPELLSSKYLSVRLRVSRSVNTALITPQLCN